jgi:hypothetical protein
MPNLPELPDISGKNLVAGIGKGARKVVVTAGSGALAVGGFVVRRVLGGHGESSGAEDAGRRGPAGETVTAPPPAVERPADRPTPQAEKAEPTPIAKTNGSRDDAPRKPEATKSVGPEGKGAKPKPGAPIGKTPKAKAAKPKADAAKAKPSKAKPKAAKAKAKVRPPLQTGTDAPPKPSVEPGNISLDRDHPHRALSNPVGDPDETEYPDPFETREDPRDPVDPDELPLGAEPHPPTGAVSTSEPRPASDPEVGDRAEPPKRENLDQ